MFANVSAKRLPLLLLAIGITVLNITPLVWVGLSSFKTRLEIFSLPPKWIPASFDFGNYTAILADSLPFLINSIVVTLVSTLGVLIIALPAAFALSVFRFKRQRDLEMWILSTRMMPPIAAAIPLYLASRSLGLYDTLPGLILVMIGFNLPFAIWMATSFMRQLPGEILEASRMDGCTWLQVLMRVVVPISSGGIATVVIFTALFIWNELLMPLFLTSRGARTFTVVLTSFQGQTNTVWEQMAAGATLQILPIVIMTFLVQRYIVAGLTMGAVK